MDNIVREQIEDVLRSKNVGSRKMRRKEKEEWFLSLFDDAMQTRAPGKEDRQYLQQMLDDMVCQVPISDLVIMCFNLGRAYERRKEVEVV